MHSSPPPNTLLHGTRLWTVPSHKGSCNPLPQLHCRGPLANCIQPHPTITQQDRFREHVLRRGAGLRPSIAFRGAPLCGGAWPQRLWRACLITQFQHHCGACSSCSSKSLLDCRGRAGLSLQLLLLPGLFPDLVLLGGQASARQGNSKGLATQLPHTAPAKSQACCCCCFGVGLPSQQRAKGQAGLLLGFLMGCPSTPNVCWVGCCPQGSDGRLAGGLGSCL